MHIPTVLGAVVPVYNLPGVSNDLNFSSDVIADIYLGQDFEVERQPPDQGQSGRQLPRQGDPAGVTGLMAVELRTSLRTS